MGSFIPTVSRACDTVTWSPYHLTSCDYSYNLNFSEPQEIVASVVVRIIFSQSTQVDCR